MLCVTYVVVYKNHSYIYIESHTLYLLTISTLTNHKKNIINNRNLYKLKRHSRIYMYYNLQLYIHTICITIKYCKLVMSQTLI